MEKSALFLEIFGNEDAAPVTPTKIPSPAKTMLPFDTELYSYSSVSRTTLPAQTWDRDFIANVSGMPEPDVSKLLQESVPPNIQNQVNAALRGSLFESYVKNLGKNGDMGKAQNVVRKFFKTTGSLSEAMAQAFDLFRETFTPEEKGLVEKAMNALDLSLFLSLLTNALKRT